jgi:hypothetical protein
MAQRTGRCRDCVERNRSVRSKVANVAEGKPPPKNELRAAGELLQRQIGGGTIPEDEYEAATGLLLI